MARSGHQKVFNYIDNYSKPIIAAINGYALSGGLELALACYIRTSVRNSKMGFLETTLGLIPGCGSTQRLLQIIGKGIALEMGMVSLVCESEDLKKKCIETANILINNSPFA